jgi:hypothetical protein
VTTQGTPSSAIPQEQGHNKRPIIHTRGAHKKAKAHKYLTEYTIIVDDANLVVERVQDRVVEEFKEAQH